MSEDNQFSFWEKETFLKPYDLVVVGAGIVGLSSALFYKRGHPQARVLVLDKGFMPEGASTRNAGFACVGSISEHLADMEKESEDNVRKRIQRRHRGLELLKQTLGEQEIGYRHCGGYELFADSEKYEQAVKQIPRFNSWMDELLDEQAVYTADTLNGYSVIHNRLEGALHPGKMMQRYVELVLKEGVDLRWNAPVAKTSPDGTVILEKGPNIQSDKILIAANGFAQRLLPEIRVTPARGLVFVTNAMEKMQWRGTFHFDRGYIYFRDLNNRLLLGGARNIDSGAEQTDTFGVNSNIKQHLVHFADDVLHLASGWQIEHEWSGIMGFTESKTPVLRKVDDYRYVAAGLSGMGVAIGTSIGQEAASLLNGK